MARPHPQRLERIAGIGVGCMGARADAAGRDYLWLENLDVDIPPDPDTIARTRRAAAEDAANSYLPDEGQARHCLITAGGLSGILNALLAAVDEGDGVVVTDPTYAGLLNRVRLAGGIPTFVPFTFTPGAEWRLDRATLRAAVGPATRAMLLMSPPMLSGGYLDAEDWRLVAELCAAHDLTLILDAAMERLLYDGRAVVHPADLPGDARAYHHRRLGVQGVAPDRLARRLGRGARVLYS